jgi:5-methylcytosine-specific restriction endonuclease McrA
MPIKSKAKKRPMPDSIAHWSAIRRGVLDRDGYRCRICGADGCEAKLNVHHIDYNRGHNQEGNLVTLCSVCHKAVHMEGYKPELYEDWPIPWGRLE